MRGTVLAYPARNDRSRPKDADDDEEFVVVRVGWDERAALLAEDPRAFVVTPHYQGTPGRGVPSIIVRLEAVAPDRLRHILIDGWRLVASKALVRKYDGG